MRKKLTTAGNTWQLYINKPIAQLIGINVNDYSVCLRIENKNLIVSKIKNDDIEKNKDLFIKKLIKRSSGYGLNISLPILELLEINPENDFLNIEINENILIIKKAV